MHPPSAQPDGVRERRAGSDSIPLQLGGHPVRRLSLHKAIAVVVVLAVVAGRLRVGRLRKRPVGQGQGRAPVTFVAGRPGHQRPSGGHAE